MKSETLMMQGDGNLVLCLRRTDGQPGVPLWLSNTWGHPGARAVMQGDGNLVAYGAGGNSPADALWASGTWGNPQASARLQDDANLVIYRRDGTPIWQSGTWSQA